MMVVALVKAQVFVGKALNAPPESCSVIVPDHAVFVTPDEFSTVTTGACVKPYPDAAATG